MAAAISLALCTYNGARHLKEQIDSILRQTRLPEEIIVCDDASSDGTTALLQEQLAPFHGRLVLRTNPQNIGFKANFIQALSLCTGDIICLSDQDDVWEEDKIACLAEALEKNPRAQLAFHDARLVDKDLQLLYPSFWAAMRPVFDPSGFRSGSYRRLFYANVVQGAACALRRELFEAAMPFPEEALHDEWLALAATAQGGLIPIEAPLLQYRQDNNTLGGLPTSLKEKISKWTGSIPRSAQTHYQRLQHQSAMLAAFRERYANALDAQNLKDLDQQAASYALRVSHIRQGLPALANAAHCQSLPREYLKDILAAIFYK